MAEPTRPPWEPTWSERVRGSLEFLGTGRLLAIAVSVVAVLGGGWWLLHAPAAPIEQSLPRAGGTSSVPTTAAGSAAAPATTTGVVVVQAAGAVVRPGVYTLPAGSRVQQLIEAAGGAVIGADPDALALATVLVDGQRVDVPMIGEEVVTPPAGPVGSAPTGPLDLNRATAEQLDALPGVGPSTAAAIVEHRTANGPFRSVDDLLDVRGIGPAKLDAMRAQVTV